ncbi:MAG: hypothetical protein WD249_01705 [Gaiellaceae bacterium]
MIRSLKGDLRLKSSIAPDGNRTSSINGATVDLRGYGSALAIVHAAAITDGTHTPKLQESSDDSSWSDVAAADLDGSFVALETNLVQHVAYKGTKRYIRLVVTVTGSPGTGGKFSAGVLVSHPGHFPIA